MTKPVVRHMRVAVMTSCALAAAIGCSTSDLGAPPPSETSSKFVATLTLLPSIDTIARNQERTIEVSVRNAAGDNLPAEPVVWTTSDSTIASVTSHLAFPHQNGVVLGMSPGTATITAAAGGKTATATVVVRPFGPATRVVISPGNTIVGIGVPYTFTARPLDIAQNEVIGRQIAWSTSNPAVASVNQDGRVNGVSTGTVTISAAVDGVSGSVALTVVAPVETGRVESLNTGGGSACAVNTLGAAFCWGEGMNGQLGNNAQLRSALPVPVAGEVAFRLVVPGPSNTCGIAVGGSAYCWGRGDRGANGNGSTGNQLVPVQVSGTAAFTRIGVGARSACGLTDSGQVLCWGDGEFGQLGDGSVATILSPAPIWGDLRFTALSVGPFHACALTSTGIAYCWGDNRNGAIGDGSTVNAMFPKAVPVSVKFSSVAAGDSFTCGLDPGGAAWCWGSNFSGQLGIGSTVASIVPVAVSGGLTFTSLAAGSSHACGIRPSGDAYCWGGNESGSLGNGPRSSSALPVAVGGGLKFASLSAGNRSTCGMTTTGSAYCWGMNVTANSDLPIKVVGSP